MERHWKRTAVSASIAALLTVIGSVASAHAFGPWSTAVNAETQIPGSSTELNTDATEGCPILSPDGLHLYMASSRAGGLGGLDIWVSSRDSTRSPWGVPKNAGEPINSTSDDFCPTPLLGGRLLFVSARPVPESCGGPDIYATRSQHGVWSTPKNLGCNVNSAAGEAGPSLMTAGSRTVLYFSSTRPGGFSADPVGAVSGDADIYASTLTRDGFGQAELVPGLNTEANDARPNLRHDGLEVVFDSDRPGSLGGPDIYSATRRWIGGSWSVPQNLGSVINSPTSESRASLSWNGRTMVFGSTRPASEAGSNDIYITTRTRA